jgi:hypothetical protein
MLLPFLPPFTFKIDIQKSMCFGVGQRRFSAFTMGVFELAGLYLKDLKNANKNQCVFVLPHLRLKLWHGCYPLSPPAA